MTTPRQQRFRRALLPANPPDPSRPRPEEIPGRAVFLRLRRLRATPAGIRAAIRTALEADPAQVRELAATRAYLYTDATHWGLEMVPVNFTRTYGSVARLCRIAGVEPPPKFSAIVRPRPAAIIEFQFAGELQPRESAVLTSAAEALAPLADNLSTFECDHRYVVLANPATTASTLFLAGMTKVPPDRSARDAHDHWINHHAALFADNLDRMKDLAGYVQVHTTEDLASPYDNEFGGVAFLEYDNMAQYLLGHLRLSTITFNNTVVVDEKNVNLGSEFYLMKRGVYRSNGVSGVFG